MRDEDGSLLGGMCFVQDVTRVAGLSPRAAGIHERFRLEFENAPIGKAIVELDGTFRSVNPALCRITGYDPETLLSLRFQDITHPG